jgi:molecular chaperone GrpE
MSEMKKEESKDSKKAKDEKKESRCAELKDIEALRKEVKEREDKLNEVIDTLQRLQAEFENHAKRADNEKKEIRQYAEAGLIKKLLPVLDSFELALKSGQCCSKEDEKIVKGMEMIYSQLSQLLKNDGLRQIDSVGKKFDPYYHEVLMVEEDGKRDDDIVVEELQKGYMFNGKVLRYSKVKINKKAGEVKNENRC